MLLTSGSCSPRRPVKPLSENKRGGDERFNSFTTHFLNVVDDVTRSSRGERRQLRPPTDEGGGRPKAAVFATALRSLASMASVLGCFQIRVTQQHGQVVELVDTRHSECRAIRRGSSNLPLVTAGGPRGCPGAQLAFIRPVSSDRYRDLQLH